MRSGFPCRLSNHCKGYQPNQLSSGQDAEYPKKGDDFCSLYNKFVSVLAFNYKIEAQQLF